MAERMGANGMPMKKKAETIQEILEVNPNEKISLDDIDNEIDELEEEDEE